MKVVDEPLFKSYVFVKVDEDGRTAVRMTDGVVNFVYWNGKPANIKEKEIEAIRKFLDEYSDITVLKTELKPNEKVVVTAGALMDKRGKVIEVKNKVVKVLIESLGYILVADIDKSKLALSNPQ
jgi:transcription antitermination factor NusG